MVNFRFYDILFGYYELIIIVDIDIWSNLLVDKYNQQYSFSRRKNICYLSKLQQWASK